jgi:hypothetical protein
MTSSSMIAAIWPWLFPATYLAHIAEEYWGGGGFSVHLARSKGIRLTPARFLALTGAGWVLMVAGILLSHALKFPQLLLVVLATVVLINGLWHALGSVTEGGYTPGLITGVLVWAPLGAVTLFVLRGSMGGRRYLAGLAVGVAVHVVVTWLASRGEEVGEGPR